jgi:hypothetical protein
MRRSTNIIVCTLALMFCLAALPLASTAQESGIDSHGRSFSTVAPAIAGPASNVVKPATALPEGTTVIYSNFGSGDSYDCCFGWTETGPESVNPNYLAAMAFTPTKATYQLTQLDLALSFYGVGTNGVIVELCGDDDGVPGKVVESWSLTGLPAFGYTSNVVQTIQVKKTVLLIKNTQYWLVVIPNSNEYAVWNVNAVSVSGWGAESFNYAVTWDGGEYSPNGAFDVLGTALPQSSGQ